MEKRKKREESRKRRNSVVRGHTFIYKHQQRDLPYPFPSLSRARIIPSGVLGDEIEALDVVGREREGGGRGEGGRGRGGEGARAAWGDVGGEEGRGGGAGGEGGLAHGQTRVWREGRAHKKKGTRKNKLNA